MLISRETAESLVAILKRRSTRWKRSAGRRGSAIESLEQRVVLIAPVDFEWGQVVPAAAVRAVDDAGNLYAVGSYSGTLDFDPGDGVASLTSVGAKDVFITKTDGSGKLLWAKSIGGALDDTATGLSIDSYGSVFVTGTYSGAVDLDPGSGTAPQTSTGLTDVFILKLDGSGNRLWSGSMGGPNADTAGRQTTLFNGNLVIYVTSGGSMDFDPGTGAAVQAVSGNYLATIRADGQYIGVRQTSTWSLDGYGNQYSVSSESVAGVYPNQLRGTRVSVSKTDAAGNLLSKRFFTLWQTTPKGHSEVLPGVQTAPLRLATNRNGETALAIEFFGELEVDPSQPRLKSTDARPPGQDRSEELYGDYALIRMSSDLAPTSVGYFDSNGLLGLNLDFSADNILNVRAGINSPRSSESATAVDLDPASGVFSPGTGSFDLVFDASGALVRANRSQFGRLLGSDAFGHAYYAGLLPADQTIDLDPGPLTTVFSGANGMEVVYKMSHTMIVSAPPGEGGEILVKRNQEWAEAYFKSSTSSSYQLTDRFFLKDISGIRVNCGTSGKAVVFDFGAGGHFALENGITVNGSTSTDSVRLKGLGTEGFTYAPNTVGAGVLLSYGQKISFSGIDALQAENLQHLIVTPRGSADIIRVGEGVSTEGQLSGLVTGATGAEQIVPITFAAVRDLTIDTGLYDGKLSQSHDMVSFADGSLDAAGLRNVFVRTGRGNDTLLLSAVSPSLDDGEGKFWFLGGAGIDRLTSIGDTNWDLNDSRLVSSNGARVLLDQIEKATITGGASRNHINAALFSGDAVLDGGSSNDILRGGSGDDQLYGGTGDDRMFAGSGNDIVFGQDGHDQIWGDSGDDTIYGAAGNDSIWGGDDNDWIAGDNGNDRLFGESGMDILIGGNDNDLLNGGTGDDVMTGSAGIDLYVLAGTSDQEELQLVRPTATSASFRRKPRGLISVLELDALNLDSQDEFNIQAFAGDDLISIDLAFQLLGSVDGGEGLDSFSGPTSWFKSNL